MSKFRIIFVLGAPGAGKGTQCAKLVQKFGFVHMSTGDLVRSEIKTSGPMAGELKRIIDGGNLISSEILVPMMQTTMEEHGLGTVFLIDGFPRNQENLDVWNRMISGVDVAGVLHFNCPEDEVVKRLMSRGRSDDNPDAIRERLTVFRETSRPIIDAFGSMVQTVHAVGTEEEVYERAEQAVRVMV